jgi:hypothetical protein
MSLYDSTFSRTVWRRYGGAKGLVVWYYQVVQFGYLVLFAPAYPLAPFLAFVNNILEIRFGGYKMCHGFQRPQWKQRANIGSWLGMLSVLGLMSLYASTFSRTVWRLYGGAEGLVVWYYQVLGFAAVITNASMIYFVGSRYNA